MRTAVGWLLLVLCLALAGCSRAVGGAPAPTALDAAAGELIQPAQPADLLTPSASLAVVPGRPLFEEDLRANLFIGADPATCDRQGKCGLADRETCSPDRSLDIRPLVAKRLRAIHDLLSSTA